MTRTDLRALLALSLLASITVSAHAAGAALEPPSNFPHDFKVTAGRYDYGDSHGTDVNLRWKHAHGNAWIGRYGDADIGSQWRAGFDSGVDLDPDWQLQPSLQIASGGFVGGSVALQWSPSGQPFFGLIGWGRTNVRPYFNLNFDPNDAITAGAGWQGTDGTQLSATLVADDRLHTGQKDGHVALRRPLDEHHHVAFDVMRKIGEGDGGPVRAWGCTATYDAQRWFLRVARDPKQNFSVQNATRVSVGTRF